MKETFTPIRNYYHLVKPGIVRGNLITAAGGFLLASQGTVDVVRFGFLLAGLASVVASAGVFNSYLDRALDSKMKRTSGRPIPSGRITGSRALIFGTLLLSAGTSMLALFTTAWATAATLAGFASYVFVYTPMKYRSPTATSIGSVPGAMPPLAGYTAASGQPDMAALLLFVILVLWQLPHFYAIAIFRLKEYQAGGIPVLPARIGLAAMRRRVIVFVALFTVTAVSLTPLGYTGYTYAVLAGGLGSWWLSLAVRRPDASGEKWGRSVFVASLFVLLGTSVGWMSAAWLP
jgi:heme o synthase